MNVLRKEQIQIRMRSFLVLVLILTSFIFTSCDNDAFYHVSYSFKNHTWSRKQKPTFNVEIKDTSVLYDFVLTVRTSTHYSFNNMWVYFISKTPDKQFVREPFEIKIADEKGYWIGKKTGSIVENQLVFKRRKLPKIGTYYFMLEQGITDKVLYNVYDISLEMNQVK